MDKVLPRPHALQVVAVGMRHRRHRRMLTVDWQVYRGSQDSRLKRSGKENFYLRPNEGYSGCSLFCLKCREKEGLACWTVKLKLNIDRV